jgi:hypothetical protein
LFIGKGISPKPQNFNGVLFYLNIELSEGIPMELQRSILAVALAIILAVGAVAIILGIKDDSEPSIPTGSVSETAPVPYPTEFDDLVPIDDEGDA